MTSKEKAKELFDKMCLAIATETTEFGYYTNVIHAKKCALIAVEEILKALPAKAKEIETLSGNINILIPNLAYWIEVKSETEKL
jgi:hypothetical protein